MISNSEPRTPNLLTKDLTPSDVDIRWVGVGDPNLVVRAALRPSQARHKHENRKHLFHFLYLSLSVFGWTPRGLFFPYTLT